MELPSEAEVSCNRRTDWIFLHIIYISFPSFSSVSLPYLTLPHIILPYLTLPHIILSYLTLPYLTLRHITLSYLPSNDFHFNPKILLFRMISAYDHA